MNARDSEKLEGILERVGYEKSEEEQEMCIRDSHEGEPLATKRVGRGSKENLFLKKQRHSLRRKSIRDLSVYR